MKRAELKDRGDDLPRAPAIDVSRLVESFGDMTQCYKVLFLRALIDELREGDAFFVSYHDLAVRMVEAAWWPMRRYLLKTGNDDLLGRAVLALPTSRAAGAKLRREIGDALPPQRGKGGFLFHVPQRLLKPWFAGTGLPNDDKIDAFIKRHSGSKRGELVLPYGQDEDRDGVDVHPVWRDYFVAHAAVLTAWLDFLWLDWLQVRNPLVPVTRRKLAPPPTRSPLSRQRAIFKNAFGAMTRAGVTPKCIFTGETLSIPSAPIDHFLPWCFVAHDGLWNLVPVANAKFNSKKSDRIPDRTAVAPLARLHRWVITSLNSDLAATCSTLEEYGLGLRREPGRLLEDGVLEDAYIEILPPLMATARSMGFREMRPLADPTEFGDDPLNRTLDRPFA